MRKVIFGLVMLAALITWGAIAALDKDKVQAAQETAAVSPLTQSPSPKMNLIGRQRLADRCGATQYYCNPPTPVCCYSQSRGYYCAASLSQC